MNETKPLHLGVNIDHVATLRQVRGTSYPRPAEAAVMVERAGADSITVHLREDRRHIQDSDLIAINEVMRTHMNLECAVTDEMLGIAIGVGPADVCLVPESAKSSRPKAASTSRGSRTEFAPPARDWPRQEFVYRCSSILTPLS